MMMLEVQVKIYNRNQLSAARREGVRFSDNQVKPPRLAKGNRPRLEQLFPQDPVALLSPSLMTQARPSFEHRFEQGLVQQWLRGWRPKQHILC